MRLGWIENRFNRLELVASRFGGHINSLGFLSGVWPIEHLNMRIKSCLMKGVIMKLNNKQWGIHS